MLKTREDFLPDTPFSRKTPQWIVDGLIPEGHLVLVVGHPGKGKSWWLSQMAVDVSQGKKHLTHDVTQCSVIYIDEDTPWDVYEKRKMRLAIGEYAEDLPIDDCSFRGFSLFRDTQTLIDKIKILRLLEKHVLVVIDCLGKVTAGADIDKGHVATGVMTCLTNIRNAGATVIVVHHISLKKKVTMEDTDAMSAVLNSTLLISG